jgi:hypothetical protein
VRLAVDAPAGVVWPSLGTFDLPVLAQAVAAESQAGQVVDVQAGVGDPPADAPVQADQHTVVAPQLQVVKVDVGQHGSRGVVVAGNGPVFVVYSRSVGDGGQGSCTQSASASPVRRASCSGSIVRPQALQFCLGVGKVIFNRQPVTFVAAGRASGLVPMRSSLAGA